MKSPRLENAEQVLWTREKLAKVRTMIQRTEGMDHPAKGVSLRSLGELAESLQLEIDEFEAYERQAEKVKQAT